MFESWSYEALQIYWWVVVSVVGALFVFMMFVQGGQTMLGLAKDEDEKTLLVNAPGKKWKLTFTTLVLFGGALFGRALCVVLRRRNLSMAFAVFFLARVNAAERRTILVFMICKAL